MMITNVQTMMIRKIRGLDDSTDLGDLTAEDAITEIKAAMAQGFDPNKAWQAATTPAPARRGRRIRNGICTWCYSSQPHNCECSDPSDH